MRKSTRLLLTLNKGVGGAPYDPVAALGADLLEYWDAEIASQIVLAGSDVASWTSGKGLALADASTRPVFNASDINGKPGVDFTGSNSDKLGSSGLGAIPSGAATCELWLVVDQRNPQSAGVVSRLFRWGNDGVVGQSRGVSISPASGTNRVTVAGSTGSTEVGLVGTQVAADGKLLIRARWEADRMKLWVNGTYEGETLVALAGTATTRARMGSQANSGGGQYGTAGIGIAYVTKLLSDDQAAALASYFAQRYGF